MLLQMQAFFLVADDVMDYSVTRRGQPCWYKKVGKLLLFNVLTIFVMQNRFFFLLACRPNGDDEVEIQCLHSCLSRMMSIASFMFSCKRFKSSWHNRLPIIYHFYQ